MIPHSMRWRLPLSYAGIALLAALALGAVLLITLRGYYARREVDYLTGNAKAIGANMAAAAVKARSAGQEPLEFWQPQLPVFSFLSQTRIQVLNTDLRVEADSGSPVNQSVAMTKIGLPVSFTTGLTLTGDAPSVLFIRSSGAPPPDQATSSFSQSLGAPGSPITEFRKLDIIYRTSAVGTPFGFGLGDESEADGRRSDQVVRQPFHDPDGQLLGYVQLSEGPAYGRQIVESVTLGWAIASVVAVLLAAGVGWLISRRMSQPLMALTSVTTRMAAGDLSARADVTRRDEFGALANAFNEMAGQVEETVVTLRRFLGDAAHELHTPLTALRTNLELTEGEPDSAQRAAFLERAQQQVSRLEMLTSGLLDLSRIEAGAPIPAATALNLSALVRESSEAYASRAEQCGLQFALQLPAQDVSAQGHEAQLRRALGNLLDNALKFTPPGGAITAGLRMEGGWIELWVQDTGIGIPPEDLPLLFNRFHRARNAVPYPGSGLGLAIVKAIVAGHGGDVTAENTSPGARFRVRLPQLSV